MTRILMKIQPSHVVIYTLGSLQSPIVSVLISCKATRRCLDSTMCTSVAQPPEEEMWHRRCPDQSHRLHSHSCGDI